MRFAPAALAGLSLLLFADRATAAAEATARGVGGAITARLDASAGLLRYHGCASLPCAADGGATANITLDRKAWSAPSAFTVEALAVAPGQMVLHARVPSRDGHTAWEAVVARTPDSPGGKVLYSGVTGLARGEEGERTGEALQVFGDDAKAGVKTVVVGDVREDLRLCGQAWTLLTPRGLDPKTWTFRGASVQRLPRAEREKATRVVAVAAAAPPVPPLAPLLAVAGASTAFGPPTALLDGDRTSTWSEARPGVGAGEFVVFRAPAELTLTRLAITPAPPKPSTAEAAPRTFYVATDSKTFAVTMPGDAMLAPGTTYEVPLPEGARTSCLAIVLDDAYVRPTSNADTAPRVTLAEVAAYSDLDTSGASLSSVARLLAGGGPRAQAAAALLKRAGDDGLDAVLGAYDSLDAAGRALAVDVAAAAPSCRKSAALLVRAQADPDREVARKGRGKLERCGTSAIPVLVETLRGPDMALRAEVASLLAAVSPRLALAPLAGAMGEGPPAVRSQIRGAFGRAARGADKAALATLVEAPARSPLARLDLLRAAGPRLVDVAATADAAVDALLAGEPTMATRYLILGPLAELTQGGDPAATARFTKMLAHDPEWPVRARAAELATHIPVAQSELLGALADPAPRVREAALHSVGERRLSAPAVAVIRLLEHDPWTFVRAEAAAALGAMPPAADIDRALLDALEDASPLVRVASIEALSGHRAGAASAALLALASDEDQDTEVRIAATRALGPLCDPGALDLLSKLALKATSPVAEDDDLALALAAIDALGAQHPSDLARRLDKLRARPTRAPVRRAAEAAFAAPGSCHR